MNEMRNDTRQISENFEKWCLKPGAAIAELGELSAAYLLTPEARREGGIPAPVLPERSGSANCLMAHYDKRGEKNRETFFQTISRSFILPVQWVEGSVDSGRLPGGFSELADSIRDELNIQGWRLEPAYELGFADFSALNFSTGSLWAPLAASLILAEEGGRPSSRVFATGEWKSSAMVCVECIKEKIQAVLQASSYEGGQASRPILFVPEGNQAEARRHSEGRVDIRAYPRDKKTLRETLLEHLRELDIPPSKETDPLETRIAYANRTHIVSDGIRRRDYYLAELVDELAPRLHSKYLTSKEKIRRLALVISKNYELCVLLLKAIEPEDACLLYSEPADGDEGTEKYLNKIRERGLKFKSAAMNPGREEQSIADCVEWLNDGVRPENRAVDVTGGTKAMSLALADAALKSEARILYLNHNFKNSRPVFGTEELRELDWFYKETDELGRKDNE